MSIYLPYSNITDIYKIIPKRSNNFTLIDSLKSLIKEKQKSKGGTRVQPSKIHNNSVNNKKYKKTYKKKYNKKYKKTYKNNGWTW